MISLFCLRNRRENLLPRKLVVWQRRQDVTLLVKEQDHERNAARYSHSHDDDHGAFCASDVSMQPVVAFGTSTVLVLVVVPSIVLWVFQQISLLFLSCGR